MSAPKASVSGRSFGDQTVGDLPASRRSWSRTWAPRRFGSPARRSARAATRATSRSQATPAAIGRCRSDRAAGITVQFTPSAAGARSTTIAARGRRATPGERPAERHRRAPQCRADRAHRRSRRGRRQRGDWSGRPARADGKGRRDPAGHVQDRDGRRPRQEVKRQKCTEDDHRHRVVHHRRARAATRGSVTYATGTASAGRLTLHAIRAIRGGRYPDPKASGQGPSGDDAAIDHDRAFGVGAPARRMKQDRPTDAAAQENRWAVPTVHCTDLRLGRGRGR